MHFEWWCHFLVCPKQIRQAFLQMVYHPSHPLHQHGLFPIEEIFVVISFSFKFEIPKHDCSFISFKNQTYHTKKEKEQEKGIASTN